MIDSHLLIRKVAEVIQGGVKPYKLIENPQKVLSGEKKKIVLNKVDNGLVLYEEQVKMLKKNGLDLSNLDWKSKFNNKVRYVIYENRDDPVLVDAVEAHLLKDFIAFEVPVEEWAWVIKFMKKQTGGSEYVEMLL